VAAYTYTGAEPRYYPSLALTAEPGMRAELAEDPGDGRWEPAPPKSAVKAAQKEGEH